MRGRRALDNYLRQELIDQLQRQRRARIHNGLERLPDNQLVALGLKKKGEVSCPINQFDMFNVIVVAEWL